MNDKFDAPLAFPLQRVLPEWIDFNGHMNVAYYVLAFDRCVDVLFDLLQIGPKQIHHSQRSAFVLESHINYINDARENDPLKITGRLLDYDEKRIHYSMEMYHAEHEYLMAAQEQLAIHVDLTQRESCPMSEKTMKLLAEMLDCHSHLASSRYIGRVVGIQKR